MTLIEEHKWTLDEEILVSCGNDGKLFQQAFHLKEEYIR
jgi:hypothetical protein